MSTLNIKHRTRNSKTHLLSALPDGSQRFAWDGGIGAVHYKDKDGNWQDIDNVFEPSVAPWDWQMLHAGYHIKVKEDFTAGQIIEFEKQGETVHFQPMALGWTNDLGQIQQISMPQSVVPVISNPAVDLLPAVGVTSHEGTIRWNNAYGSGIDFEWKCASTRLVKILQINSFANLLVPQQYIIDGGNPVLRLNLIFAPSTALAIYVDGAVWDKKTKRQTFNAIEFSKGGEVLWSFKPMVYKGSNGNRGKSAATLEKSGNNLYISVRIPYSWLQSAIYPVVIDPVVDEQVGAGGDDAYEEGDGSFWAAADVVVVARYTSTSSGFYMCGGHRFQTVNVPNAAVINVAYMQLHWDNVWGDDLYCTIYGHDVDDADDFVANPHIISVVFRPRTTANTPWSDINHGSVWITSPSIVGIIQEIVNRVGWAALNDMVLLCIATVGDYDEYGSYSFEDTPLGSAKLHIEYTLGGGGGGGGGLSVVGAAGLLL